MKKYTKNNDNDELWKFISLLAFIIIMILLPIVFIRILDLPNRSDVKDMMRFNNAYMCIKLSSIGNDCLATPINPNI